MKNFKYSGQTIPYTPSGSDVSSGDPVLIGDLFGVAVADIADGEEGAVQIAGVVSEIPKEATTVTFAKGEKVYWDVADGELNDDDANNKHVGYAYSAAGATDATVTVLLVYGPAAFNGL